MFSAPTCWVCWAGFLVFLGVQKLRDWRDARDDRYRAAIDRAVREREAAAQLHELSAGVPEGWLSDWDEIETLTVFDEAAWT